jgi:hypothetical protein
LCQTEHYCNQNGILNLDIPTDDETIPKQDTQFATPRKRKEKKKKMEKEEYHVYCDKDGPEIDVQLIIKQNPFFFLHLSAIV